MLTPTVPSFRKDKKCHWQKALNLWRIREKIHSVGAKQGTRSNGFSGLDWLCTCRVRGSLPQGESPVFEGSEGACQVVLEVLTEEESHVGAGIDRPGSNWSLATMERLFARRPELETYAWRIQGAV
jgi:hypothetical protein